MSDRKITIKVNEKDLLSVLEELTGLRASRRFWNKSEIQLTLDLQDKKEVYEYLTKSKKIIDWGLGDSILPDSPQKEIEEPEPELSPAPPQEEPKEKKKKKIEKFTDYVANFTGTSDWSGLAIFIMCSWKVSKKSPGMIFGTPLFKSSVSQEYENFAKSGQSSSELILLGKVLESYYYGVDYEDAVEDVVDKIRTTWKAMSSFESLTSVSIRLFKNT